MNRTPLGALLLGLLHLASAVGLAILALVLPFMTSALAGSFGQQHLHMSAGGFGVGVMIAVALLVAAALTAIIGLGLVRGRNWARVVTIALSAVGFVVAVPSFAVVALLWNAGVIYYMTRPTVARQFR